MGASPSTLVCRAILATASIALAPFLAAQSTIDGQLIQQLGRQASPVTHCTVFAQSIDNGPLVGEYPDDGGRFFLAFPPDGRVSVGTICPGYSIAKVNGRATPPLTYDCSTPGPCATVEITLEPLAAIEGQVLAAWGAPIQGIPVALTRADPQRRDQARRYQAVSDDRGHFRLYHLPPGAYELTPVINQTFQGGLTWQGRPQTLEVAAGDEISGVHVQLDLIEPTELTGRIGGLPPGTEQVQLLLQGGDRYSRSGHTYTVEVDADGRFRIPGVRPGEYQVRMQGGDSSGMAYLGSVNAAPGGGEATLSVQRPASLIGLIVPEWPDRDDLPAPEALRLQLVNEDGFGSAAHAPAPDYRFEARDLPAGTYTISLNGPGARLFTLTSPDVWEPLEPLSIGEGETVELTLKATFEVGRLIVLVRPPEGAADSGHYVVAFRRHDGAAMLYPTDQNGKLVLRYFSHGNYQIGAWRELSREQAQDEATWRNAGEAIRDFTHEGAVDMEITLTAVP